MNKPSGYTLQVRTAVIASSCVFAEPGNLFFRQFAGFPLLSLTLPLRGYLLVAKTKHTNYIARRRIYADIGIWYKAGDFSMVWIIYKQGTPMGLLWNHMLLFLRHQFRNIIVAVVVAHPPVVRNNKGISILSGNILT
jgi:hypothetical protein